MQSEWPSDESIQENSRKFIKAWQQEAGPPPEPAELPTEWSNALLVLESYRVHRGIATAASAHWTIQTDVMYDWTFNPNNALGDLLDALDAMGLWSRVHRFVSERYLEQEEEEEEVE